MFSGVAGALSADLAIGDVVIADTVVNMDMNVKEFVLPHQPDHRHARTYTLIMMRRAAVVNDI